MERTLALAPLFPPLPCFFGVQLNSLPTYRRALLSEHLEQARSFPTPPPLTLQGTGGSKRGGAYSICRSLSPGAHISHFDRMTQRIYTLGYFWN